MRTWGELAKKKRSGTYKAAQQIVEQFGHDLDTPWRDLLAGVPAGHPVWRRQRASGSGRASADRGRYEWTYEGTVNGDPPPLPPDQVRGHAPLVHPVYEPAALPGLPRPAPAPRERGGDRRRQDAHRRDRAEHRRDARLGARASGRSSRAEQLEIGEEVLKEIQGRLQFLMNVGLHYLTLDRPAPTLSGGEGQRIRLASQIGCGLVGVLYVLDEPSIGLHQRDNRRLLDTLEQLRDMGNTVVVVEHDEETMRTADWIVDLGPGAGVNGGWVVAAGPPEAIMADPDSLTGRYLRHDLEVSSPNGQPAARERQLADRLGRAAEQPQGPDRALSAGAVHLRDRRLGQRQVVAGGADALSGPGPRAAQRRGAGRRSRPHRRAGARSTR